LDERNRLTGYDIGSGRFLSVRATPGSGIGCLSFGTPSHFAWRLMQATFERL
jgi:hypothetical protein